MSLMLCERLPWCFKSGGDGRFWGQGITPGLGGLAWDAVGGQMQMPLWLLENNWVSGLDVLLTFVFAGWYALVQILAMGDNLIFSGLLSCIFIWLKRTEQIWQARTISVWWRWALCSRLQKEPEPISKVTCLDISSIQHIHCRRIKAWHLEPNPILFYWITSSWKWGKEFHHEGNFAWNL